MRFVESLAYRDPICGTGHIELDLESANKNRITLGLSIQLTLININFDYNISEFHSATAGLFIGF